MPGSYTVKSGDTLTKIAIIEYGDGTKYRKIFEANPVITDPDLIYPGQVLSIPPIVPIEPVQPAEIEVSPDTIIDGISDEIAIVIDGVQFVFWSEATINLSFDSIADSFSLSAPWFPDNETYVETFVSFKYSQAEIYIGGVKVLTGTIIKIKTETVGNSRVINLEGYSLTGIIADVNVSPNAWPVSIDGLNLKQIAEKLVDSLSLSVVFDDDPGPAFSKNEKQLLGIEEKIADYLIKLAKQRGFVMGSNPDGELVFRKTTIEPATITIIEGKLPYQSSSTIYNGQTRFSDVTAVGTESTKGSGQTASAQDSELKANGVNRPFVFKASDTNPGGLKAAARAELGRQIAASTAVSLTVKGFHRPDGFLWLDNEIIGYQSDGDMIYSEIDLLIRNVKYNKTPDSTNTELSLVLPESYE